MPELADLVPVAGDELETAAASDQEGTSHAWMNLGFGNSPCLRQIPSWGRFGPRRPGGASEAPGGVKRPGNDTWGPIPSSYAERRGGARQEQLPTLPLAHQRRLGKIPSAVGCSTWMASMGTAGGPRDDGRSSGGP